MQLANININDFDYNLPQERIAKYPVEQRDLSKLLLYRKGEISETEFFKLPEYIPNGSSMVFNNSKVICARLIFKKETGANIEIFCLEPFYPVEYQQNLQNTSSVSWKCLIGNKKKWKSGILINELKIKREIINLKAEFEDETNDDVVIKFSWNNQKLSFGEILNSAGKVPIPPYLMREAEDIDVYRYQTIYSSIKGSVAAPTAGLHFTPRVFEFLDIREIPYKELTLHVGAGTFKPVQTDNINEHLMHEEIFSVTKDQLKFIINNIGNIIAVGTTSTRMLESIYQLGINCFLKKEKINFIGQWDAYNENVSLTPHNSIVELINYIEKYNIEELWAKTSIMIVPGYQFKMIKGLVTNFHQPRSTLLLLIAALVGKNWKEIYNYALNNNFRFLSYGDSSLLMP